MEGCGLRSEQNKFVSRFQCNIATLIICHNDNNNAIEWLITVEAGAQFRKNLDRSFLQNCFSVEIFIGCLVQSKHCQRVHILFLGAVYSHVNGYIPLTAPCIQCTLYNLVLYSWCQKCSALSQVCQDFCFIPRCKYLSNFHRCCSLSI